MKTWIRKSWWKKANGKNNNFFRVEENNGKIRIFDIKKFYNERVDG